MCPKNGLSSVPRTQQVCQITRDTHFTAIFTSLRNRCILSLHTHAKYQHRQSLCPLLEHITTPKEVTAWIIIANFKKLEKSFYHDEPYSAPLFCLSALSHLNPTSRLKQNPSVVWISQKANPFTFFANRFPKSQRF